MTAGLILHQALAGSEHEPLGDWSQHGEHGRGLGGLVMTRPGQGSEIEAKGVRFVASWSATV